MIKTSELDPAWKTSRIFFIPKNQKPSPDSYQGEASVPGTGIEPVRDCSHKILSLACLPVPPSRHSLPYCRASGSFEITNVLKWQSPFSRALLSGRRDSNSRPRPGQGRALPAELLSLMSIPKTWYGWIVDAKVSLKNNFTSQHRRIFLYWPWKLRFDLISRLFQKS